MRTARAISGREERTDCGAGNRVLPNSIRWAESRTVSKRSLKTPTAHSWSAGMAEFNDSLTEKPRRIPLLVMRGSRPEAYFAIAMAVCGLEHKHRAWCMYIRDAWMCFLLLMASQATTLPLSSKIAKAMSG